MTTQPMSETPRTDAAQFDITTLAEYCVSLANYDGGSVVPAAIAKQLERELAAAQGEVARLRAALGRLRTQDAPRGVLEIINAALAQPAEGR